MKKLLFAAFLTALPYLADASVIINEVAWMGTANSATDEWIELFSDKVQDLSGWTLSTADGGMNIALSGSITAGGYYLIERTDDTAVSDITADLVAPFGSGLSNSYETLILKDSNGTQIDEAGPSGNTWPAGDNSTKETMQFTLSGVERRWITASATPKASNHTPVAPTKTTVTTSTLVAQEAVVLSAIEAKFTKSRQLIWLFGSIGLGILLAFIAAGVLRKRAV